MPVSVPSEIGRLRSVLVHTPGPELLAVTPDTRGDYLYDDIIDVESARREHRRFVALLERFAEVHQVGDLLGEIIDRREVRELLMRETMDVVPSEPLARELMEMPGEMLGRFLVEGRADPPGPLGRFLNETGYSLPPLPNLFFTRDVAMAINEHVMIGAMRIRRAMERGAAHEGALPASPESCQRRHPVRRQRRAAPRIHARGR